MAHIETQWHDKSPHQLHETKEYPSREVWGCEEVRQGANVGLTHSTRKKAEVGVYF